jgi:diguanylate cyclase (GGDEF)-like protein/putative nucleotidyltransferase with HDIG domain
MHEDIERASQVISIQHDAIAKEAADKMLSNNVGCLVVYDDDGQLVGILSERDVVSRAAVSSGRLEEIPVSEIMTTPVVSCSPDTPPSRARELMTAHRIRHLPVVERGVVVGILSARDLMGLQLLEDRAAAEEVAMLSKCLKSIDLKEVANIITREAPKLFEADRCVLCFRKKQKDAESLALVSRGKCKCPENRLLSLGQDGGPSASSVESLLDQGGFYWDEIPEVCEQSGGHHPRLVVPLDLSASEDSLTKKSEPLRGYLCMCGFADRACVNKELLSYKARLAREVLNAHLTNARLYQKARMTSLTDALTGIGSRKYLEDKLHAECARAARYRRPFSVAIIDLDHFKTINDVLGHASGDGALKKLAACMNKQKRTPDVLARYGGDEFVILMPETKAKDACVLLERLRAGVQQIEIAANVSMTISCGAAQSSEDFSDSPSDVIRRADLALYEAKSAGRNCVKVWDERMSKRLKAGDIELQKIRKLQRRIAGLSEKAETMFMQSIWGLVQALEAKDPYAKKHSENVMHYATNVATVMGLSCQQTELIRRAAMIHDIGKIGVPDAILSKPEKLTPHERRIIEQHPLIAVRILGKMSFLEQEIAIVRHHHEKYNGEGYPDGLSKSAIPRGARILAVADMFDALTSPRSYHNSRSVAQALEILVDSAGYELDPEAVKAMSRWIEQVAVQFGEPLEQLTTADLLQSQQQFGDNGTPGQNGELVSAQAEP